jgi:hypothetical protein
MEDFLRSPDAAASLGMVGMFICIAVIAVGCTVAVQWRKARQAELEVVLKREMLHQGKSADDIEKVLRSTASVSPAELEAALKRKMLDRGMSADDIAKVLGHPPTTGPEKSPGESTVAQLVETFLQERLRRRRNGLPEKLP